MKRTKVRTALDGSAKKSHISSLCLAFLLIFSHAVMLQHVAVHELEKAVAQDNDSCSFCAVASHAAAAVTPDLAPVFTFVASSYVMLEAKSVGFTLFTVRSRGPPLTSIA